MIEEIKNVTEKQNRRGTAPQSITEEVTNESVRTDRSGVVVENTLSGCKTRTKKSITAAINKDNSNVKMDSNSEREMSETSTIEFADKPPHKTPICYTISQEGTIQTLGLHSFDDEVIQKVIPLMINQIRQNRIDCLLRDKRSFDLYPRFE